MSMLGEIGGGLASMGTGLWNAGSGLVKNTGNFIFGNDVAGRVGGLQSSTPGLFSRAGSWIESNPNTFNGLIGIAGGLASYGLEKDKNNIQKNYYDRQMNLAEQLQARNIADADENKRRRDEAEKNMQNGVYATQNTVYKNSHLPQV